MLQPLDIPGLHVAHGPEGSLKPKSPQQLLRIDVAQKRADPSSSGGLFCRYIFRPCPIGSLLRDTALFRGAVRADDA